MLTGEGRRIAEGARLLDEGRAQRMLISGVFRRTGKKALLDISGLPEDKFDCCVDIGYTALDTAGNANETRAWAVSQRLRQPHRRYRQLSHAPQPRRAFAGAAGDAARSPSRRAEQLPADALVAARLGHAHPDRGILQVPALRGPS